MKSNYKAISIDLDGTLLNNQKKISDYSINVLKKIHDLGICVVIATGRSFIGIPEFLKNNDFIDYYILSNGASCCDKNGKLLFNVCIDSSIINNLIVTNDNVCIEYLSEGKWYINSADEQKFSKIIKDKEVLSYVLNTRFKDDDLMEKVKNKSISIEKINFNFFPNYIIEGRKYVDNIVNLSNGKLRCWTDKVHKMDLYNNAATKGESLEKLLSIIGYSMNDVIGFGDDDNDLELLSRVGLSVSMDNANEEIKSICKFKTNSNNEDGVAKFLASIFEL